MQEVLLLGMVTLVQVLAANVSLHVHAIKKMTGSVTGRQI